MRRQKSIKQKFKLPISVCLRLLLVGAGIWGILQLLLPFVYARILNMGNATGIMVLLFPLIYGLFMPRIHKLVRAVWQKKIGKIGLVAAGTMVGLVFLLAVIETGCMVHASTKAPAEDATLVVLGCRTYGDRPSVMLASRLDASYEYLTEHPEAVCVVSGGQGPDEPISEGEFMYQYLVRKGIAAERIYRETESTSTRENLQFSKKIIEAEGLNPKIAIVTNEYHEYRASMIAEALDLEHGAIPAKTPMWLLPTYYIRELYGILYEWVL
ncbi:MAG: YdcF family protein [Lachnospiraceae bacterium]|nr:YdcF family protein [Lachnospiraceae bacterium]